MTGKEALENLCITYDENGGISLGDDYLINNPLVKIIKQDLDRLEKLEKAIEILKGFNYQIYKSIYIPKKYDIVVRRTFTVLDYQECKLLKGVLKGK